MAGGQERGVVKEGEGELKPEASLPEGSLSGLYSSAFFQMRSTSLANSRTVTYLWESTWASTVDRSMGLLITVV